MTMPRGVALAITPYNFPISSSLIALTASIAAGNCTLLRPSKSSPHCFSALQRLINESFAPEHAFIIDSDHQEVQSLLLSDVDFFYFMGSRSEGLKLSALAAGAGVDFRIHLSGKCPVFIDEANSSYLAVAVKRLLWAKTLNLGQSCTAPEICFVPQQSLVEFRDRFSESVKEFYGNQPLTNPDLGRLRSKEDVIRLAELIAPTKVLCGGEYSKKDRYFSPTLVTGLTQNMPIFQEEIFGPVLCLVPYTDKDEAFESFCQLSSQALAAYLFSNRPQTIQKLTESGRSTELVINDVMTQGTSESAHVGGRGHFGFQTFSQSRFVFENTLQFELPGRLPPYRRWMELASRRVLPWL